MGVILLKEHRMQCGLRIFLYGNGVKYPR